MTNPKDQAATQRRRIEESTGLTVSDFTRSVRASGLEKHGQILSFLKAEHGLGHGNANLMAHTVREAMAGGPADPSDVLAAQYGGGKAALRPIYNALATLAESFGDDVEKIIQKTGVSFRRRKQFALVRVPSAKRVELGLNLAETPADSRVIETTGMCSHRVDFSEPGAVDGDVAAWMRDSYERAG